MNDIEFIRRNPEEFDRALVRRGLPTAASAILSKDALVRSLVTDLEARRADKNRVSQAIGDAIRAGSDAESLRVRAADLDVGIRVIGGQVEASREMLRDLLAIMPNRIADDVPDGADASGNQLVMHGGVQRQAAEGVTPRAHDIIGKELGLDAERAADVSGARFSYMVGPLARLERALGQWMLNLHVDGHGYREVSPPLLVRQATLYGTGHLPKFEEDLFTAGGEHYLIPTAEVPLTAMAKGIFPTGTDFPLRYVALTPCFRAEAGAAGRDTRGILRQHQFHKVELVSITMPEQSADEHERMTTCAERVLTGLGLEWRRMLLCAGDTGFAAAKTFDLEVWMPGQQEWREISSCSNCTDFQARRLGGYFRRKHGTKPELVHTLNGSGVAVGRALAAVLETYQQADGSVTVPDVLRPYMGGMTVLRPNT